MCIRKKTVHFQRTREKKWSNMYCGFIGRCLISKAENARPRTMCRINASPLWFTLIHSDYTVWCGLATKYTILHIHPLMLTCTNGEKNYTFAKNFNGFLFKIEILDGNPFFCNLIIENWLWSICHFQWVQFCISRWVTPSRLNTQPIPWL